MLTNDDREWAIEIGAMICEDCQSLYSPVDGYVNLGHQCNSDAGLEDRYYIGDDPII